MQIKIVILAIMISLVCAGPGMMVQADTELISFSGKVVYEDIEGGFWGILTDNGDRILPDNLPDQYKISNLSVSGEGMIQEDVVTIQMWGQPFHIDSITVQNPGRYSMASWYSGPNDEKTEQMELAASMDYKLLIAASSLQNNLSRIDSCLRDEAENLTGMPVTRERIEPVLERLLDLPGVYEVTSLNPEGIITAAVPDSYQSFIGTDLSSDLTVASILLYPDAALSPYHTTAEGDEAVILTRPVYSDRQKVSGYISVLINPEELVNETARKSVDDEYGLMVIQPDGIILSDADQTQIGKNTWTDPRFVDNESILTVASHMQQAFGGYESYTRQSGDQITRIDVIWTSVSLHGSAWRVAILKK